MNKKGNIYSIVLILVIITVVACTVVMTKYLTGEFYTQMNAKVDETPQMIQAENKMLSNFLVFDYAIIVLTIFLIIGLAVSSFMIPTHPVFMVVNVIGIFILVYLGMLMNNVFGDIMTAHDGLLYATSQEFPKIVYLMQYLPYLAAVMVFILSIVMFSRSNAGGTY